MIYFVYLFLTALVFQSLAPSVLFESATSRLYLKGASRVGSLYSNSFSGGVIKVDSDSAFDEMIEASNMIYDEDDSLATINGSLYSDPLTTTSIQLESMNVPINYTFMTRFIVPTFTTATVSGSPIFLAENPIVLEEGAVLELSIKTPLARSLDITDARLRILNRLQLAPEVVIEGAGIIQHSNGSALVIGSTDTVWTSTITWLTASSVVLNGDVTLYGSWTFQGNASISAHNNLLHLAPGSSITVAPHTTLELNDIVVSGLGTADIFLHGPTAQLSLFDASIVLNNDYTYTTGSWYAAGPAKIVTGEYLLTFNGASKFTVDRDTVLYDTLNTPDDNNIRFESLITNREYLGGGSIRKVKTLNLGDYHIVEDTTLDTEVIISPLRKLYLDDSVLIDGAGFYYQFARGSAAKLVTIAANKTPEFKNILLKDWPLNNILYDTGSSLRLGHATQIQLASSGTLTATWTIDGSVVIDGGGKTLAFASGGNIVLRPGATLLFDNIRLNDLRGSAIRCMDDSATVSFGNVMWQQDANFTFSRGRLGFIGRFDLTGSSTFFYTTTQTSTISDFGIVALQPASTFMYAPASNNRALIWMDGDDATLELNGGALASTTTGLQLTRGTFDVRASSIIRNEGGVSDSQAIMLGNGIPAHDMTISLASGAELDIQTGLFVIASSE